MTALQTVSGAANKLVTPLLAMPGLSALLGRGFATISYVGRRSGKTVTLPVNYRKSGNTVTVMVAAPSQKSWWRNFFPDGGPVTVDIAGTAHHGTAVARKNDRGGVRVVIELDA
ncbi:MAG: hypothetical protein WBF79_00700 [Rhodococcus sp. (in: high G+C Gram-positive bacteria)]